jgi:hypothetical protein
MLRKYLSSVVRGFEWYVIRGEPQTGPVDPAIPC